MRSNSVDIIFITWRKAHQNRCLNGKQDFQIQEIDFRVGSLWLLTSFGLSIIIETISNH